MARKKKTVADSEVSVGNVSSVFRIWLVFCCGSYSIIITYSQPVLIDPVAT